MTVGPGQGIGPAGRYRLDSRIATGGMGEVWRADDTVLGRGVAVKLLKAELADDPTFRARFETEARHAAALHHPGVAAVFDFGETPAGDGGAERPFLVMELVQGQPLSALLRPGEPMDPEIAADLIAQAADAIGAAHAAGIVHRDVKPANLLVTPDRRVKITDFGIARAADGLAITQTGQVIGTPQYLSPEQASGHQATEASDVYSLGVVLFECLAGRRPFVGDTPVTTALAHLREPVPDLPAAVPAGLAAACRRALAKEPAERFESASALAAALRDPSAPPVPQTVAVGPTTVETPTTQVMPAAAGATAATGGTRRRRPGWLWPVLLLALLILLLLLAAIALSGDDDPSDDASSTPSETPSATAETTPSEPTSSAPTTPTTEATPEDETISIDSADYEGRPVKDVQEELKALDLKVKTERLDNDGTHEEDTVASVDPDGDLQPGDEVVVSYWGKAPGQPDTGETGAGGSGANR